MRSIILFSITFLLIFTGAVYSTYQVAEVYVCEESIDMANVAAKARVSRKELYIVSYCNCAGIEAGENVTIKGEKCSSPKTIYSCTCVGRESY